MKINVKNIVSEYPKLEQGILPDALKKNEFDFINENLDLYNDDNDIKKYIDTFIQKLNQIAVKTPKKKTASKTITKGAKYKNGFTFSDSEGSDFEVIKSEYDKGEKERNYLVRNVTKKITMWLWEHNLEEVINDKSKPNNSFVSSNPRKLSWKPKFKIGQRAIWTSASTKTKHPGVIVGIDNANPGTYLFKGDEWEDADNVSESGLKLEPNKTSTNIKKTKIPKKKTSTKRSSTTKKKEDKSKKVGSIDLQVTFIKTFVLMHGKSKTKKQILNLYKRIEKAATELKIRKTSKFAKQIMFVINELKFLYNSTPGNLEAVVPVEIPTKKYNELYEISYSEKQRTSVALIKRYVGMFGLEWNEKTKKRAENLLKAIRRALSTKTVKKNDMYFDKIKEIESNIEGYLLQNNELFPDGFDLRGLTGLAGIDISKKKTLTEKKQFPGDEALPVKKVERLGSITLPSAYDISQRTEQEIEYFKLNGDIGKFLGKLEKKPKHSIAVTLDAEQGAGKTRAFFQFADELAKNGYNVLFVSFEEHPESSLFQQKQKQYISSNALKNFYPIGEVSGYEQLAKLIPQFDVVMIDSWNKIKQMSPHVDFDRDLRKAFDGKLFFAIFQRTQDGKMRGGSQAQFDGDIILKVNKQSDFKDNYIYADKNRYQDKDLSSLFYNVYYQKVINESPE